MRTGSADRSRGRARRVWTSIALMMSGVSLFVVEVAAVIASPVPYDVSQQAVSDLAATTCGPLGTYDPPVDVCSPLAGVVNASWVATGVFIACAVLFMRREGGRRMSVAVWAVAVAAICQAAVGLVPVNVDLGLHITVALGGFVAQLIGVTLFGLALKGDRGRRTEAIISFVLAVIMAGGFVSVMWSAVGVTLVPVGIAERAVIYGFQAWVIVVGAYGLSRNRVIDPAVG